MWIRFRKDEDLVNLVFNSLMTNIYNLNDIEEIVYVLEMINNVKYQIENPALLNSRFMFEEVLYMDINIHQLNLTRDRAIFFYRLVGSQEGHNKSTQ